MNRIQTSITTACLAVLVAACSSSGNSTSPQGGSGGRNGGDTSVSSSSPSGGTTSNPGGGTTSSPGGGTTSNPGGGATSSPGGSTGNPGGGSTSNPGGGSTSNPGGGSTTKPGGSTGNPGGSSGNPGGSSGNPGGRIGGTGGPAGGASGGGATGGMTTTGAGGTTAAGGTPTGGSSSAGGATSAGPAVYISTNGSCVSGSGTTWTPGTVTTSTGSATVTVNDSSASQTWEGFGGAFNEKGWQYLQMLSSGDRDRAMQLLFGADGAHFNLGRIPIGASDYAVTRYTCDEASSGTDTSMASFSTSEDEKYLIPYVQAAMAVNKDIKFWASPWTPPTWMKSGPYTASTEDGSPTTTSHFDSGNMTDDNSFLTAYAQYFVKFVNAYKAANINISVVAPQNEPNYALCYPSCIWTSALYTKFVGQYLGPALKDTGVSIMLGTLSNNSSGKDEALATAALADSTAKGFLKVAGVQWGVLDDLNSGSFSAGGLPVWATEHKCGNYPWNPSGFPKAVSPAPNDQAYGVESWGYIRDAITKGKVTAYNAWNMVLDTGGLGNDTCRPWNQDALLAVDTSSKALKVTSAYCVFRHFSQFVAVGAKRVATTGGDAVAFKNPDGTLVAVMYNSGSANTAYVVSIGGQKLQFSMPAAGWATVKVKP